MSRFKHFPENRFKHFPTGKLQGTLKPYGYTGCFCWFDPAFGITRSGTSISFWFDRLRDFAMSQTTAVDQPSFVAALAQFNNHPAVSFVAGTTFMSVSPIPTGPNMTIAFVVFPTFANAVGNNFLSNGGPGTGGIHKIFVQGNAVNNVGTGVYNGVSSPVTQIRVSTFKANSPQIVVITAGNNANVIVNGVAYTAGSWQPSVAYNYMGGINGSTNHDLSSYVGEILFFNRSFSDVEAIALCNAINEKYAIY